MFRWFRKYIVFFVSLALPIALSMAVVRPASADEDDQSRAREALMRGEVRPLTEILEKLDKLYHGDVLDVELEDEEYEGTRTLVYEIKLLTPEGNLIKLYFDAKSLALINAAGHDVEGARKKHETDSDRD